jgi:hypothetical protein
MTPGVNADARARQGVRLVRVLAVSAAIVAGGTAPASADWLLVPHSGLKFGGETTLVDLEKAAPEKKTPLGVAGMWLGAGLVGAEVDFTYIPDYFDRKNADLVTGSSVRTLTGSVVVAAPLSLTRESLRPYLVGGVGWMHSESEDFADLFSFKSDLWAMNVGGGVIGFLSDGFGVRLDLRFFRNISEERQQGVVFGDTKLSYWRLGVGLVFKY